MVLVSAITLVALPFLWSSKQSSPTAQQPGVAAMGEGGGLQLESGSATTSRRSDDVSYLSSEPGYLGGASARTTPATIALTVKAAQTGHRVSGSATFRYLV